MQHDGRRKHLHPSRIPVQQSIKDTGMVGQFGIQVGRHIRNERLSQEQQEHERGYQQRCTEQQQYKQDEPALQRVETLHPNLSGRIPSLLTLSYRFLPLNTLEYHMKKGHPLRGAPSGSPVSGDSYRSSTSVPT